MRSLGPGDISDLATLHRRAENSVRGIKEALTQIVVLGYESHGCCWTGGLLS